MAFALIQFNLDQLIFQAKQGSSTEVSREKNGRAPLGSVCSTIWVKDSKRRCYMWRRLAMLCAAHCVSAVRFHAIESMECFFVEFAVWTLRLNALSFYVSQTCRTF